MSKFKKFWNSYKPMIVVLLTVSGLSAPLVTGVVSVGDMVAADVPAEVAADAKGN